jgi:phage terminase large subunit GpA-like protein
MCWPVGTWSLKSEFYANLHKAGLAAGEKADPSGYCHFHEDLGEEYFRQITAERFRQDMRKGKLVEEWLKIRQDNHFLDARIYAMAMAELLGLSKKLPAEWAAIRAALNPGHKPDLLTIAAPPIEVEAVQVTQSPGIEARRNAWANRKI